MAGHNFSESYGQVASKRLAGMEGGGQHVEHDLQRRQERRVVHQTGFLDQGVELAAKIREVAGQTRLPRCATGASPSCRKLRGPRRSRRPAKPTGSSAASASLPKAIAPPLRPGVRPIVWSQGGNYQVEATSNDAF